jgi:hypothetical protein
LPTAEELSERMQKIISAKGCSFLNSIIGSLNLGKSQPTADFRIIMPKKQNRIVGFILLIVFALCGWWIEASFYSKTIQFDLRREDVAKQFQAPNAQWASYTGRGFRLACPESCYILTPMVSAGWEEFPYIKVRVAESNIPSGEIALFWNVKDNVAGTRSIRLAGSERMYIVSAKSFRPWEQEMPWRGQINRIGANIFSGTVTISEISLADSLTPWEWVLFSVSELRSVEPFLPYSINILWGASIDGWSLTILAGCLAVLFLLIAIYRKGILVSKAMPCLAFGLILIVDAPFLASLIHTLKDASTQSAWRSKKEEEERSRFGPEYAELARALRQAAPVGSAVFIPQRQGDRFQRESEWIEFQLWPQYRTTSQIENADYFLLLHPLEARYDSASGTLILPNRNPIKVSPPVMIYADVMLLKRQRG